MVFFYNLLNKKKKMSEKEQNEINKKNFHVFVAVAFPFRYEEILLKFKCLYNLHLCLN